MSSRPLLKPQIVMDSVSVGSEGNFYSLITYVNMISICSYSVAWTGTPTGTFSVEVCNDYVPPPPTNSVGTEFNTGPVAGSWTPIVLTTPVTPSGSAGTAFIDIDIMGSAWVRLHYAPSGGSGIVKATIAGKCA